MAESRLHVIVDNLSADQWRNLTTGRVVYRAQNSPGISRPAAEVAIPIRNLDGNVITSSIDDNSFGVLIFMGYQESLGSTSFAENDRLAYYRQPDDSLYNADWSPGSLRGSTPGLDAATRRDLGTIHRPSYWSFGGGASRIGYSTNQYVGVNAARNSHGSFKWNPSSGQFDNAKNRANNLGSTIILPRSYTRQQFGIFNVIGAGLVAPIEDRVQSREEVVAVQDISIRLFNPQRTTIRATERALVGSDLLSLGDGNTIPGGRQGEPVIATISRFNTTTLSIRLQSSSSDAVTSTIESVGWSGTLPTNGRLADTVATGRLIWAAYPKNISTSNRIIVRSASQPVNPGALVFSSETSSAQPPPMPGDLTAADILRVTLAESTLTAGGRRLAVIVEFRRDPSSEYFRTYTGGAIVAPVFYMTGDYTSATNIAWEANWLPLISPADQATYGTYLGTDVRDGDNSIVHGVAKHGKRGQINVGILKAATRGVTIARIGTFREAPQVPVMNAPTQEEPAEVTASTAGSFGANANFPLMLSWLYRSNIGGEQYGYRLRRRQVRAGVVEYWTRGRWVTVQDDTSLIVDRSISRRGTAVLPGSATSGWARSPDGLLIDDILEFSVQTFSEENGLASDWSNAIAITPGEARDPFIYIPNDAFNTLGLFGSVSSVVDRNEALTLPSTLELSVSTRSVAIGATQFIDFDNGTLIRTLTDIRTFEFTVRGTLSAAGRIELYASTSRPSQARVGQSVTRSVSTSGSDNSFALTHRVSNLAANTYIYVAHNRASSTTVNITQASITGTTGDRSTQSETTIPISWLFAGDNATAQSAYRIDLYEGAVTDFDTAEPIRTLIREKAASRNAAVNIFTEGTYTVRLITTGQPTIAGGVGLRAQPAYAIFELDLIDPAIPTTQRVRPARLTLSGDKPTPVATTDTRGTLGHLYDVIFPRARIPLTPGAGSVYGYNGELQAVWREPWPNGSDILEWEFRYDRGNNQRLLISEIGDPACPSYTWTGVPNGRRTVQARCRNAAGWSSWSQLIGYTVRSGPVLDPDTGATAPVAPPGVRLEVRHGGRILVSMCDPAFNGLRDITRREFRYSSNLGGSWTNQDFHGISTDAFISGRVDGRTYWIEARVYNEVGASPWSERYAVVPPAASVFTGAIPDHALVYRREVGTQGDGIVVAQITVDNESAVPRFQFFTMGVSDNIDYEYRSVLYTPDAPGSRNLVEFETDWVK